MRLHLLLSLLRLLLVVLFNELHVEVVHRLGPVPIPRVHRGGSPLHPVAAFSRVEHLVVQFLPVFLRLDLLVDLLGFLGAERYHVLTLLDGAGGGVTFAVGRELGSVYSSMGMPVNKTRN